MLVGLFIRHPIRVFKETIDELGGLKGSEVRHSKGDADTCGTCGIPGMDDDFVAFDSDGIFDALGIRFGLEVCLDHAQQRLVNTLGHEAVQVQLITSCGMSVKPSSVVSPTALTFHCDGLMNASKSSLGAHSSCSVGRSGRNQLSRLKPRERTGAHGAEWRSLLRSLYVIDQGAPNLAVYPPVALPEPADPSKPATPRAARGGGLWSLLCGWRRTRHVKV